MYQEEEEERNQEQIDYVRQNINPLYKLDKTEAMKYSVSMGASDTARGIAQLFGKAGEYFGLDGLSEKLKEKDTKLKAILESEEYGTDAMVAFLTSAVVADPAGYVPIVGWVSKGKKAKNLMELTKYGAKSGAVVASLGYTAEDQRSLLQGEDAGLIAKRTENALIGSTFGAVLGGGGGKVADVIQQARGKGSIFKSLDDVNVDKVKPTNTAEDVEKIIVEETSKVNNKKYELKNGVLKKYQDYVGKPMKNLIFNNPGESLGFIGGYNSESNPDATYSEKIINGIILAGTVRVAKNIQYKDTFIKDLVGRAVIDSYNLTPQYMKLKGELRINKNEIGAQFYDIMERAKKELSPEQNKLLYSFMVGDIDGVEKLSPEALAINKDVRILITEYANEFVKRGLLDPEVFQKNINTYLKRSYLKPKKSTNSTKYNNLKEIKIMGDELKNRGLEVNTTLKSFNDPKKRYQKEGWEIMDDTLEGDKIRVSRDFTKAERLKMEEIEDASYAIAETGRLFANDLATARFYDDIAKNPKFVMTKTQYKGLGEKDKLDYTLVSNANIPKTNKKKYGKLANKYVQQDVLRDIDHVQGFSDYTKYDSELGKELDKFQTLWKKTKTAWNPSTHVGNTASNVILIDFADTDLKYVYKAFKQMKDVNSKLHKQAKIDGIFDADFIAREFAGSTTAIEKSLLALRGDKFGSGIIQKTREVLKAGNKISFGKMEDAYQFEDQVFRMAVYMDRLDKGYSQVDAALDARKWFIDYDINAPLIKMLKRTVVPFVSYTYRVIPLLAEAATLRPHKFAKWAAYGHILNKGSAYFQDDLEGEKIDRASGRKSFNKKMFGDIPIVGDVMPYTNIRIPFDDVNENALYFDVTRWIPGGDIFEQRESEVGLLGLPSPLQPGGLYVDAISNFMFKRDPFTGQSLEELGVDATDNLEILKHFSGKLLPNMPFPFTPGTFARNKRLKAISVSKGELDGEQIYGSDYVAPDMPWATIAYGLGFKLRPQDSEANKKTKDAEYNREKGNILKEKINIRRNFEKNGLGAYESLAERDKELLEQDEKMIKLAAEREIYLSLISNLSIKSEAEKKRKNKFEGGMVDDKYPVPSVKKSPADRKDSNSPEGKSYAENADIVEQLTKLGLNK